MILFRLNTSRRFRIGLPVQILARSILYGKLFKTLIIIPSYTIIKYRFYQISFFCEIRALSYNLELQIFENFFCSWVWKIPLNPDCMCSKNEN